MHESLSWSPVISSLLLNVAAKSVFIAAAGIAVILCLPRASAAIRHMLAVGVMAGILLLPALSIVLPRWEVLPHGNNQPPAASRHNASIELNAPTPEQGAPITLMTQPTAGDSATVPPANPSSFDAASALLPVWLAGVLISLVPSVIGLISLWSLTTRCQSVTERRWLELLEHVTVQLHVKRRVVLVKCASRSMPM